MAFWQLAVRYLLLIFPPSLVPNSFSLSKYQIHEARGHTILLHCPGAVTDTEETYELFISCLPKSKETIPQIDRPPRATFPFNVTEVSDGVNTPGTRAWVLTYCLKNQLAKAHPHFLSGTRTQSFLCVFPRLLSSYPPESPLPSLSFPDSSGYYGFKKLLQKLTSLLH